MTNEYKNKYNRKSTWDKHYCYINIWTVVVDCIKKVQSIHNIQTIYISIGQFILKRRNLMIQVCDAIMGTGKSSAAITYMNEHLEDRFIYVTPYLEEAERIKECCPDKQFVEPSDKLKKYNFKKIDHTAALIKEGRNITTTHQAFKSYSSEMLEDIKRHGYRLIIDENVDVLEKYDCSMGDIQLLMDAGYMTEINGFYKLIRNDYNGVCFRNFFDFLKSKELICLSDSCGTHFFYWLLSAELMTSFKDVIILTYLFEGQSLHHFLEMYNLEYEYIGIQKTDDGTFRFCEYPGYTPEYTYHIKDMIHILDKEKLNSVGDDMTALSMGWYDKNEEKVEQLKKNMFNCVYQIWGNPDVNERLWGCYKSYEHKISGKGYKKAFLTFNTKATNAYRNRKYLMYIVNVYMNVTDKLFYQSRGIKVNEDLYALSIMVQWIWRSAIRDGDDIYLYIPSKRMRILLINWMNSLSDKGGDKGAKELQ